jgi:peptide-methionine (S)-S-oxide reductase
VGTQYRSAIFTHGAKQDEVARAKISDLTRAGTWDDPIVTVVEPLTSFYPAENYHAAYFERNGNQPYCQFVVAPKVAKARQKFSARLKRA